MKKISLFFTIQRGRTAEMPSIRKKIPPEDCGNSGLFRYGDNSSIGVFADNNAVFQIGNIASRLIGPFHCGGTRFQTDTAHFP